VPSFIDAINKVASGPRFYFRGDGDKLIPHIGKPWYYGKRGPKILNRNQEWQFLHRFRRFANPQVTTDSALWEALFLARHHGLPTRLLDWSTSPLVALYFAIDIRSENREPSSALPEKYVWAMVLRPARDRADIDVLARRSDPLRPERIPLVRADGSRDWMVFYHDAVKIVNPVYNSARITAQRGVFTWHSDPWRGLEDYLGTTLPEQNLDIATLYRWSVPNDLDARTRLMEELHRVGVDARSLSPDLDGVCRSLVNTELLFH
jgi:hypothetical protein